MFGGIRKAFIFGTLIAGALGSPRHTQEDDNSLMSWENFRALLDTVDPSSLHSVLHSLSPKFQDGVFSHDRSAIEHVHSENPVIASKLVHIARKRQDNSTTTATSTSATTTNAQESSIQASISSVLSSAVLASTVPAATTLTVAPSTPPSATAIATTDGAVVFSTVGGGLVTLTSEAVGVRFTPSTSTHLAYTTLPDGTISTSTSLVVVNAPVTDAPDATGAAGAAATTGGDPSLQDAAVLVKTPALLMLCAGLGGLFFVL